MDEQTTPREDAAAHLDVEPSEMTGTYEASLRAFDSRLRPWDKAAEDARTQMYAHATDALRAVEAAAGWAGPAGMTDALSGPLNIAHSRLEAVVDILRGEAPPGVIVR